ncbi:MAG TPA: Holliday junction branch migration DNA helicase RuvB [Thermotogota bacterium]|nr:Holliday junction branch migration DNA helicase RuvB [Thermotogota bacterium]HPJ88565.1 Holliday junction branch migration DNA helicase RuvB [Thermotogota bacterium]HPR96716.1 Holliday junction branch migration DNA helicase RuvB [Thermotogota bacterium]
MEKDLFDNYENPEEQDRIVTSEKREEDSGFYALRPKTLKEYIGQSKIKERVAISIEAAKIRNEPLDHVLLAGPPGLGKTTMANVIANEMGYQIHITSGPVIEKQGDLAAILTNLEQGDVLFIDEIHRLSRVVEEVLYSAMEDYSLDILIGKGPSARSIRIDLNRFTLIGATTRSGLLSSPLRNRFGLQFDLNFYEQDELETIIRRSADILNIGITDEATRMAALRSRGTPRLANRLLRRIRDFATVNGHEVIDVSDAQQALKTLEIDDQGLDAMDRRILKTIIKHYKGGPAGVKAIAAAVGVESDTISEVYEPFLIQKGFLIRSSRGRQVTEKAYRLLGYENDQQEKNTLF